MKNIIENQPIDLHPKLNKFLLCSGIVSIILLAAFSLLGWRFAFLAGMLLGNVSYILLGAKYRLAPKYISLKLLDRLTGVLMLIGAAFLCYDLIFNILPNF
ncbi:MAG: hypothetical protein ACR2N3_13255 [Pyrinomonadaceae bacterium]